VVLVASLAVYVFQETPALRAGGAPGIAQDQRRRQLRVDSGPGTVAPEAGWSTTRARQRSSRSLCGCRRPFRHGPTHAAAAGTELSLRAVTKAPARPRSSRATPAIPHAVERPRTREPAPSAPAAPSVPPGAAPTPGAAFSRRTEWPAEGRLQSLRKDNASAAVAPPSGRRASLRHWLRSRPPPETARPHGTREGSGTERALRSRADPRSSPTGAVGDAHRAIRTRGRTAHGQGPASGEPRTGGALESRRGTETARARQAGRHGRPRGPAGRLSRVRPGSRPHRRLAAETEPPSFRTAFRSRSASRSSSHAPAPRELTVL
jgi:hypothetical protein